MEVKKLDINPMLLAPNTAAAGNNAGTKSFSDVLGDITNNTTVNNAEKKDSAVISGNNASNDKISDDKISDDSSACKAEDDKTANKDIGKDVSDDESAPEEAKSDNQKSDETVSDDTASEGVSDRTVTDVSKETSGFGENKSDIAPVMSDEEIIKALEAILAGIKELLGVDDASLHNAMQNIGLDIQDLLSPENMQPIITELADEDSAICFVTNEKLMNMLNDMTATVEEALTELENMTGMSGKELVDYVGGMIQNKDISVDMPIQEMPADTKADYQGPVLVIDNTPEMPVSDESDISTEIQSFELSDDAVDVQLAKSDKKADSDRHGGDAGNSKFGTPNEQAQQTDAMIQDTRQAAVESAVSDTQRTNTENILRQIADYIRVNHSKELTEMELQLHPASLGAVKVQLSSKGGMVTAQFVAETEAVKNAIEAQATQLRLELEEQGVKIEAIEVAVESHQLERNLDEGNGDSSDRQDEKNTQKAGNTRKGSINLRLFESEEELAEGMQSADEATRVAMQMMSMHGNSMSLLA